MKSADTTPDPKVASATAGNASSPARNRTGYEELEEDGRIPAPMPSQLLELLPSDSAGSSELTAARRGARSILALLERTNTAVVLLDGRDRIESATPAARALLTRHFNTLNGHLPETLNASTAETRAGTVVVHRVHDALLLEEYVRLTVLTAREREVVALVAEEMTNAEIAQALWLSRGTVRRHLQNAFAKLGVHTRTAAAARVRRLPHAD